MLHVESSARSLMTAGTVFLSQAIRLSLKSLFRMNTPNHLGLLPLRLRQLGTNMKVTVKFAGSIFL